MINNNSLLIQSNYDNSENKIVRNQEYLLG